MKTTLRTMAWAGVLAIGGILGLGTSLARAQGYGDYPGGGYGGYGGGYDGGYGGGYDGGYGVPSYSYYGNGGHDFQPHWHTTQTPIGSFSWYGNGAHDYRPHIHNQTPYGITSYSSGLFQQTQSYSPPTPYTFMPW
jgi:hypothetical protein